MNLKKLNLNIFNNFIKPFVKKKFNQQIDEHYKQAKLKDQAKQRLNELLLKEKELEELQKQMQIILPYAEAIAQKHLGNIDFNNPKIKEYLAQGKITPEFLAELSKFNDLDTRILLECLSDNNLYTHNLKDTEGFASKYYSLVKKLSK